jgi:hypothetical protein
MSPVPRRRYIIEFRADDIEKANAKVALMRQLGIETDDEYGVVPIDATLTHFVTRGQASAGALASVEKKLGARVFSEGLVGPA